MSMLQKVLAMGIPDTSGITNAVNPNPSSTVNPNPSPLPINWPSILPNYSLDTLAENVIKLVFLVLGMVAFVGIVYSGYMMISSNGDASKFAAARKSLLWSFIGIIVITLAFWIVSSIASALNVSNFSTLKP